MGSALYGAVADSFNSQIVAATQLLSGYTFGNSRDALTYWTAGNEYRKDYAAYFSAGVQEKAQAVNAFLGGISQQQEAATTAAMRQIGDALREADRVLTIGMGIGRVGTGVEAMAGGVALAGTVLTGGTSAAVTAAGLLGGALLFGWGADQSIAGVKQGITGEYAPTYAGKAFEHVVGPGGASDVFNIAYDTLPAAAIPFAYESAASLRIPKASRTFEVLPVQDSEASNWRLNLKKGKVFNQARAGIYAYDELVIENTNGRRFVLDSYEPGIDIVSRKFTQMADEPDAAVAYIREAARKYKPGAVFPRTAKNKRLGLAGKTLEGRIILEVPIQRDLIPDTVLDAATRRGVTIRDATGKTF